jgi:hypothetical protein
VRSLRWRATWVAAAVSILALAVTGAAHGPAEQRSDARTAGIHQMVADHEAVVPGRIGAARSPLDLRSLPTELLLLAWIGALLAATLLATADARALRSRAHRVPSAVATRARLDRGPPVRAFA